MSNLLDLYQGTETARRLAELEELVQPTLEELTRTLGYERAFFLLMDRETAAIQGGVGVNMPADLVEGLQLGREQQTGPLAQSFLSGRPVRVDDVVRDPRIPEHKRALYSAFGLLAFAAVPLVPASGVLVVSSGEPVSEAAVNELLPYAGRIVAMVVERAEVRRLAASGERHAVEQDWLYWMIDAVQDPILLTDEHGHAVLHNTQAERLFVVPPDAGEGRRRAIQLNNSLLSVALGGYQIDAASALGREVTLVDPIEGAELSFELICQPATNLRTGEQGLISVLKDVTDLRRADQQIRRTLDELQRAGAEAQAERDRLNLILENVADPIVVTDVEGETILLNQPAQRLLTGVASPGERAATIALANETKLSVFLSGLGLEPAAVRRGEIQLTDPETEGPLAMSVTATEVRGALGQATAIVSVMHDLTMIRELERRTIEQQLFESEKLAAVGRLAAAVAHEINNPLEAIKNALYLLVSRTPADHPDRRFLEIASRETTRVSTIIRQMLGFYRSAASKKPTDLNAVIEEAVALLERQLRQKGVTIAADLDARLPAIPASADQLKQVFLNLFLNAQEAMPEGGAITVSTRPARDSDADLIVSDGRQVIVQVQDTGAGMSEETLRHIFEPFFSTKREGKGTGLGLWVSQGIVQQHGGQMKVRSRAGRGTTFTIALPTGVADG